MPDDVQGAVSTIYMSSEQLRLFAFEAEVNENFEMAAVYYEEVSKHLPSICCYYYLYSMGIINSSFYCLKSNLIGERIEKDINKTESRNRSIQITPLSF